LRKYIFTILERDYFTKKSMNIILQYFRKYGSYLALSSLLVFLFPNEYKIFWENGWKLLMLIMFLSPVHSLFPKLPWIWKILPLRRQLGIICGSLILAHGVGAYMVWWDISLMSFTKPNTFIFWWLLGGLTSIPLLLTSNNLAIKLLKKRWKLIQRLSYFMFVFWGVHIYFINKEENLWALILIGLWMVMKVLVVKKIVLWKK